jgi:Fe-S cluster biogenesis protein NfuA
MTREAVVAALEEVRPYLQADGGDVEVVGVEGGVVSLRLEGACRCAGQRRAGLGRGRAGEAHSRPAELLGEKRRAATGAVP